LDYGLHTENGHAVAAIQITTLLLRIEEPRQISFDDLEESISFVSRCETRVRMSLMEIARTDEMHALSHWIRNGSLPSVFVGLPNRYWDTGGLPLDSVILVGVSEAVTNPSERRTVGYSA